MQWIKSYHLSPYVQKVSKNPQKKWNHSSLTKLAKTRFGLQCPLGVKIEDSFSTSNHKIL
jgi:hypothetical protein